MPRKGPLLNRLGIVYTGVGIVRPDRLPGRARTWAGRPVETTGHCSRSQTDLEVAGSTRLHLHCW
jgi:hypothetical protein